jgi:hypothetical protein
MAGFIQISKDRSWSSANWVYAGLLNHVIANLRDNPAAAQQVEQCKWMQSLNLSWFEQDDPLLAAVVLKALKSTSTQVEQGKVKCELDGRILDDASQRQFIESVSELVEMLKG